jgi:tetratricopeptide (TPR) repeat protein
MCYFYGLVRRLLLLLLLGAIACSGRKTTDDAPEWIQVLSRKKAAVAPEATPRQKQAYADSLGAFVARYPTHSRARDVYRRIQLDFARELNALGRYQDAIRFYRAVLSDDPKNPEALRGLGEALDRLTVSRQKLLALEKGMSQRDVAHLLGKPIPGWTARTERPDCVIEAWYYRTTDRGIAGVYFREGTLFAAEENSHAKLVPLSQTSMR